MYFNQNQMSKIQRHDKNYGTSHESVAHARV